MSERYFVVTDENSGTLLGKVDFPGDVEWTNGQTIRITSIVIQDSARQFDGKEVLDQPVEITSE